MDDSWKRAYRGDKGVPHTDPQHLINTWRGCFILASISCLHTHTAKLTTILQFNWNDTAMKLDQQNWKNFFNKKKLKQKAFSYSNGSTTK